jgi:hypothetical protein
MSRIYLKCECSEKYPHSNIIIYIEYHFNMFNGFFQFKMQKVRVICHYVIKKKYVCRSVCACRQIKVFIMHITYLSRMTSFNATYFCNLAHGCHTSLYGMPANLLSREFGSSSCGQTWYGSSIKRATCRNER